MTGCSTSLNFMGPVTRPAMSSNKRVQISSIVCMPLVVTGPAYFFFFSSVMLVSRTGSWP